MKFLLAGLLWAWAGTCAGATFADHPVTYHSRNAAGETVAITFPFVVTEDKQVADRINGYLHHFYLNILPPGLPGSVHDDKQIVLLQDDRPIDSMASRGVRLINGGRTVAVRLKYTACSVYCVRPDVTIDFDARTGRILLEIEIVSEEGQYAIGRRATRLYVARLKKAITNLERQIRATPNFAARAEKENADLERKIRLRKPTRTGRLLLESYHLEGFNLCLMRRYVKGGVDYSEFGEDAGDMDILDGGLKFTQESCAGHLPDPNDPLGAFIYVIKGKALRPYLSAYGRYLILGEGDGAMPAINPHAQVFKGKINGDIPVTLYLELDHYSSEPNENAQYDPVNVASYYYDNDGKMINLMATRSGDLFELVESQSAEIPKPALRFRIVDEKLVGTWSGGGQIYPFEATP